MTPFETIVLAEASLGGYKTEMEDRAAAFPSPDGARLMLVVADGAGGRAGGALAAETLVRRVEAWTATAAPKRLRPGDVCRLLAEADHALAADRLAGETTAVVVVVSAHALVGASAGDSEAWCVGSDGTLVEDLTERQRRLRLGTGAADPVGWKAGPLAPGRTLLVASDGLFKYTDADSIGAVLRDITDNEPLENAARRLINLVRLRSGALPDDVSVTLCRRETA